MLSSEYYVKVNMAARKFSGFEYRYKTVEELIQEYDLSTHNVVESSQILFDAARLIGITKHKSDKPWRFTDLKSIQLTISVPQDEQAKVLIEKTQQKIEAFGNSLFTDFDAFTHFWTGKIFASVEEFLESFYRYVPYVKLGIDNEETVKTLSDSITKNRQEMLRLELSRQKIVLDRITKVFLKQAPEDLPDFVRESLVDYALRFDDEAIPYSI